jgi:hypothetical protein
VAHFIGKLARLFDLTEHAGGCPIKAMLFDGPEDEGFRKVHEAIIRRWHERLAAQGVRLGLSETEAAAEAETLLIAIEGGWMLARALRSSEVLRSIPERMFAQSRVLASRR